MKWQRAPAVWRVTEGRVLVLTTDGEAIDLQGGPAAVWLVLDEPGDEDDVVDRLRGTGWAGPTGLAGLASLQHLGLVRRWPAGTRAQGATGQDEPYTGPA